MAQAPIFCGALNFYSLLEIKQCRGFENMCLRRFKQGEEIYHHPSSAFGFATAFLTGAAAFAGVDFEAPTLAP